eukprot:8092686-Prorocentrum_lima.AAC.1
MEELDTTQIQLSLTRNHHALQLPSAASSAAFFPELQAPCLKTNINNNIIQYQSIILGGAD